MTEASEFSVRDGTGRFQRMPRALRDDHFRVDELRFEQIVSMAREYARMVVYHGPDDRADGPWSEMLSGEVATMASILAIPVARMEKAFLAGAPIPPFETVASLSGLLDGWLQELRRSEAPTGSELRALIGSVAPEAGRGYIAALQAVRNVQEGARRLMPRAMTSGDQDPSTSLMVAFAKLYARLQGRISRFSADRTDFYYREVLRESPRPGIPDQVDLVLGCSGNREIVLPAGTEFDAGVDRDGNPRVFATPEPSKVNGYKVARVLMLHSPASSDDSEGTESTSGVAWCDQLREDGPPRPLFGVPQQAERSASARPARQGLLLADSVLHLREGLSRVRVTFFFDPASLEGTPLAPHSGESRSQERLDRFHQAFRSAFRISYTGDSGWIDVAEYLPSCRMSNPDVPVACLRLDLAVATERNPFAPYSPDLHGEDYGTSLPLLRFLLDDRDEPHPYGPLSRMVLREVRIDVAVTDCRNLSLQNQIGPLSPLSPFAPFGPIPAPGSYLLVGCSETRSKNLVSCRIQIRWDGLPSQVDDFGTWYRGYPTRRATRDFGVVLGVMADGRWVGGAMDGGGAPLFRTVLDEGEPAGIDPEIEIDCDRVLAGFRPSDASRFSEPLEYGPSATGAFFKLTLDTPRGGFGHAEYPLLLSEILTRNAKAWFGRKPDPVPNPPYTPMVASISLDYEATSAISMDDQFGTGSARFSNRLIHLHPFGWEAVSRRNQNVATLVPVVDAPGNLFIGLEAETQWDEVSLHFHLNRDSGFVDESAGMGVRWWRLEGGRWRPLPPGAVRSDTTRGLRTSGIVVLDLPEGAEPPGTRMPGGLEWIRATVGSRAGQYGQILSVRAQAVRAVRLPSEDPAADASIVPAGTIVRARRSISGIEKVVQPGDSFGGRIAEDAESFRTRVSERLRHKGRCVDPFDFERLVLEEFPEVFKVKCFANLRPSAPRTRSPGHVLVVPVPHPPSRTTVGAEPHLGGDVLQAIKGFLSERSSESATISVENPVYERIQVHGSVRFREPREEGRWLEVLNQAVSDWLSPWKGFGNRSHFGWRIRRQELQAFVAGLDFVERVEELSVLRLASRSTGMFRLDDTATGSGESFSRDEIGPTLPWSVAVPMDRHLLGSAHPSMSGEPDLVGLGELAIGSTFVVVPPRRQG